jgi:hypothetical protein
MSDPYTLKIHVLNGDPEGVRIIDRMNWTGQGIVFPRADWPSIKSRESFARPGIYILAGYDADDDDLMTIYVGEGDGIRDRIDSHFKNKDFWSWGVAFVSTNHGLNKAHVQWLEFALIDQAKRINRCKLSNSNTPQEPVLNEADKADTNAFLKEILKVIPLVGLRAFEVPRAIVSTDAPVKSSSSSPVGYDTIVVPAIKDGFDKVFIGENCWYSVRIAAGKVQHIKHLAVYQTAPVSAITHIAEVQSIEPYGETGKYKVNFKSAATLLPRVSYDGINGNHIQSSRYTTKAKLLAARVISDLLPWG